MEEFIVYIVLGVALTVFITVGIMKCLQII